MPLRSHGCPRLLQTIAFQTRSNWVLFLLVKRAVRRNNGLNRQAEYGHDSRAAVGLASASRAERGFCDPISLVVCALWIRGCLPHPRIFRALRGDAAGARKKSVHLFPAGGAPGRMVWRLGSRNSG